MFRKLLFASAVLAGTMLAVRADAPGGSWGAWGVDLTTLDQSQKPGDDFFRYAVGSWLKRTEIPSDRTFTGVDLIIDETSLKPRIRSIVEDPAGAKAPEGSPARQVADFYASYMDTKTIESRGLEPLKEDFAAIERIANATDLSRALAMNFRQGVRGPFSGWVDIDSKRPDRYIVRFWQGGLSFGDRDYYLMDTPEFTGLRTKFVAHVSAMMAHAGMPDAKAQAEQVLALETEIAKVHWPVEKSRDDDLTYNLWTKAEFPAKAPGADWAAVFEALSVSGQTEFLVSQPDAMAGMAKLIAGRPLAQWKAYLRYQLLAGWATSLPQRFDDERFAFYGKALRGQTAQLARWKRGMDLMDGVLGEAIGQVYVARHFPPSAKAEVLGMIDVFRTALGARIQAASWMSPSTKTEAMAKLNAFGAKIGYPDRWKDYSSMKVSRSRLAENMRAAQEWSYQFDLNKLGKPIDRSEWAMTPQTNNAYYSPQLNEIAFPAGILQPPYYDPKADLAVKYGSIGATIGHEMGHGFDDQGRKSDSKGQLRDWWTKEDAERYMAEARKLVKQYSEFSPVKGIFLNGQQTLGENIADVAGLIVAFDAYQLALGGKTAPVIDGFTGEQRFFLAYAQSWMTKTRDERLRDQAVSGVHSPAEFRVNGAVRNIDAWYAAFGVTPAHKLYLKPEDRARPW
jgi:putative endopeptidase